MRRISLLPYLLISLACSNSTVTTVPTEPAHLQLISGGQQIGTAGYPLNEPITIRVVEADGTPIPFVAVRGAVGAPFAEAISGNPATNAEGLASFAWRTGLSVGPQELLISVSARPGSEPLVVTANVRSHAMRAIGGGAEKMCGISQSSVLGCWAPSKETNRAPVFVGHPTAERFVELAVSPAIHRPMDGCAVSENGRVWCFTVGVEASIEGLVELPGAYPRFSQLAVGGAQDPVFCGVAIDGSAWCWGDNSLGMLGDGSSVNQSEPHQVQGLVAYQKVTVGTRHSCGLTQVEQVWCWGDNSSAQLGRTASSTPVRLPARLFTDINFQDVAVIGDGATCAVEVGAGFPWCWGIKTALGVGASVMGAISGEFAAFPLYVSELKGVIGLATVDAATVVTRENNVGAWWGDLAPLRDLTLAYEPQDFIFTVGLREILIPHSRGVLCGVQATAEVPLCILLGSVTGYETRSFAGFGMPDP